MCILLCSFLGTTLRTMLFLCYCTGLNGIFLNTLLRFCFFWCFHCICHSTISVFPFFISYIYLKKIELYFMIHILHSVVSSPTAFSFGTLLLNRLPVSSSLMLGDRQIPPCLDLGAFELLVNSEIDACMRVLETMVFSSRMC